MDESTNHAHGPHRIVRRLGLGHTSEVLLAVASGPFGFERTVVIKRLLAKCENEEERQRVFAAEALAHARLSHPAIVRLYDFTSTGGRLELVLEYVDGVSLSRARTMLRVNGIPFGDGPAFFVASRIFSALAAAHSARDPKTGELAPVIHRDVSPGNVLVPWDGFVKLGDFGMAKVMGFAGDTRIGMLKGTYGFMAPEQVLGDPVTPRTDVYGACIVLRELLLGQPTFVRGDMPELEFLRVMSEPKLAPIESLRGGLSPALVDAFRRGLAPDPAYRTLSAAEMVDILRSEGDLDAGRDALVASLARVRPVASRGTGAQNIATPALGTRAVSQNDFDLAVRSSSQPDGDEVSFRARAALDTPSAMSISPSIRSVLPAYEPSFDSFPPAPPEKRAKRAMTWAVSATMLAFVAIALSTVREVRSPDVASVAAPTASPPQRVRRLHHRLVERDVQAGQVAQAAPVAPVAPSSQLGSLPNDASAQAAATPPASQDTHGTIVTPASARGHRIFFDGRVVADGDSGPLRVPCGLHTLRIGSAGALQEVTVPCGGELSVGPLSR